jgi:hypothetical protein
MAPVTVKEVEKENFVSKERKKNENKLGYWRLGPLFD